jgi:peroxiredoxin
MLFWPIHLFPQTNLTIGDIAPEITINDPEGNEIKLSSLKGSLVLIEFWASWDRNSRQNHQKLVNTYHKYNQKKFNNGVGFNCFSVSLDKNQNLWLTAINLDALVWKYHGCSFSYWNCTNALNYQIQKIPSYFLIDGEGKLIQKLNTLDNLSKILDTYILQ